MYESYLNILGNLPGLLLFLGIVWVICSTWEWLDKHLPGAHEREFKRRTKPGKCHRCGKDILTIGPAQAEIEGGPDLPRGVDRNDGHSHHWYCGDCWLIPYNPQLWERQRASGQLTTSATKR
jgi:hypothetical protein